MRAVSVWRRANLRLDLVAGIKADDQTALTLGHLSCSGLATAMDTDEAAALVGSQSMMTPHGAAKAGVAGLACTRCDTPRRWPGWKPARAHQGRGRSARHSSISITGDIYGHTSDATTRAAIQGLPVL